MANMYGRQVVLPLTNKSGGGVVAGDVVIIDTGNDAAFTTTTSAAFTGGVGVAQETIANNATGRVLLAGYAALVNVSASVTRGQYGATHTVAKQAAGTASRGAGTFAQWLTGGTTPSARIFSPDLAAAAGNVAADAIWDAAGDLAVGSGADTAARLAKGNAGGVLAMGNGAVIWNAGTSFPGSKATNDRYWRTDLGMEFYWDGTRWLSSQLFYDDLAVADNLNPVAAAGGTNNGRVPVPSGLQMYLIDFIGVTFTVTTSSGSHYNTFTLNRVDSANAANALASFDTSADAANTWVRHTASINAALNASALMMQVVRSVVGTPGNVFYPMKLSYRLIGT